MSVSRVVVPQPPSQKDLELLAKIISFTPIFIVILVINLLVLGALVLVGIWYGFGVWRRYRARRRSLELGEDIEGDVWNLKQEKKESGLGNKSGSTVGVNRLRRADSGGSSRESEKVSELNEETKDPATPSKALLDDDELSDIALSPRDDLKLSRPLPTKVMLNNIPIDFMRMRGSVYSAMTTASDKTLISLSPSQQKGLPLRLPIPELSKYQSQTTAEVVLHQYTPKKSSPLKSLVLSSPPPRDEAEFDSLAQSPTLKRTAGRKYGVLKKGLYRGRKQSRVADLA